jgi:chitinase
VSKSTATTLTGIALPPTGFDVKQYRERVMQLPSRNKAPSCPLVPEMFDEEPNFLDGQHQRNRTAQPSITAAAATGDLSSYVGQQIPFNQIVALGALTKTSSGTYVQANGYTEGQIQGHLGIQLTLTLEQAGMTAVTLRYCGFPV